MDSLFLWLFFNIIDKDLNCNLTLFLMNSITYKTNINLILINNMGILEVGGSTVRLGWEEGREPRGINRMVPGQVRALRGHSGPVYGLTHLIRDGPLISCSEDTTIRLWDRESGAGLAVFRGHQYPVWCVRADRLGLQFVSGSFDRTLRLWRPEAAHPLRVYAGHEGSVDCLDWHPNCNYLLSGSTDKSVRMWSHLDGRLTFFYRDTVIVNETPGVSGFSPLTKVA